jgi:hypothetical protein
VAFGATAAAWSRRAGGWRKRVAAGLLPLALHVTVVLPAIVMSGLSESVQHPDHAVNFQPGVVFILIVVPGIALMLGAARSFAATSMDGCRLPEPAPRDVQVGSWRCSVQRGPDSASDQRPADHHRGDGRCAVREVKAGATDRQQQK